VEGNGEKVYNTDQEGQVVYEFLDTLPGSGSGKKEKVKGKAEANNAINCSLFEYLESYNVPTHFLQKLEDKKFVAKQVSPIPIIVTVWNIASGDLAKRFALEEGKILEYPIVEMYLKDDKLKRPMICEYHAYALGLCERKDLANMMRIATKVNAVLKSFFDRRNVKLVKFRIEFGQIQNQVVLNHTLGADSIVLWKIMDSGKYEKLDTRVSHKADIYKAMRELIVKE
ncbi:MAG: phosphoribosylaminoimidazolesuccinocarboxamide synthase, partial [Calditrichia bacterium]